MNFTDMMIDERFGESHLGGGGGELRGGILFKCGTYISSCFYFYSLLYRYHLYSLFYTLLTFYTGFFTGSHFSLPIYRSEGKCIAWKQNTVVMICGKSCIIQHKCMLYTLVATF